MTDQAQSSQATNKQSLRKSRSLPLNGFVGVCVSLCLSVCLSSEIVIAHWPTSRVSSRLGQLGWLPVSLSVLLRACCLSLASKSRSFIPVEIVNTNRIDIVTIVTTIPHLTLVVHKHFATRSQQLGCSSTGSNGHHHLQPTRKSSIN